MNKSITAEEYKILTGQAKEKPKSKFRNQKVTTEDGRFDSKREASRWNVLRLEEKAGRITKLRRQVAFSLSVNGEHVAKYVADFVYERDGERIVEDAKGFRTELYVMKRKLMAAVHGITIIEV